MPAEFVTANQLTESDIAPYIGKYLLAGITRCDLNGTEISYQQIHGTIDRISPREGIVVKVEDSDKEFKLPPTLENLKPAQPGQYKLRDTGEVVIDPDFTAMWTVYPKGYQKP